MRTVLLDQVNLLEQTDANLAIERNKLKEKQFEVWCELVRCLDRKSLSLVKTAKPNSTQAWKLLQDCFKSHERPRIYHFLTELLNLKLNSQESLHAF